MIIKGVEKNENSTATFQAVADAAEFDSAVNTVYKKAKKNIAVPGFRKGKAPRMVIEGLYGKDVFHDDAIEELAPQGFTMAIEQESLNVVGQPKVLNYEVADDKSVTLFYEVGLYPEVTLGRYMGLSACKGTPNISDEELDVALQRAQKANSRLITVERAAADGDTVNINFEGFLNGEAFEGGKGENYDLALGSNTFVPGFESQLIGLSAGEEKDLDITFPATYHEDLAGKAVVFHVKVNEVKEVELPELDDEFAKDVSEFDTFEEYKEDLKANMLKGEEEALEEDFHEQLLSAAIENMTATIPDVMVEDKLNNMMEEYDANIQRSQGIRLEEYLGMMGMNANGFRESLREQALRRVQCDVLLTAIAEKEKFQVTEEEIDAAVQELADNYKIDVETVKKFIPTESIVKDITAKKALDLIYNTGEAEEPEEKAEETESAE
ncbi:MAG: trigger factor [Oscillospiraceae bacterium]|jgi:trigger factor